MFPSSGDLWIYDFIMVNRGGGEPQGVKGQRLALNLQGQEPSLGETASKSKGKQEGQSATCSRPGSQQRGAGVRFGQFYTHPWSCRLWCQAPPLMAGWNVQKLMNR